MKAVRLNELGGPEHLHVEEIAQPVPGDGEILVRVHRAAFNRRDVFITQNLYPGIVLPRTLGSDGAGRSGGTRRGRQRACTRRARRHLSGARLESK